ncbi:uncharacterized protein SAPINGB_P005357 [Magnusiomyces paraingens]|uniref:DNA-directed RNA polymerases I and III subunit RPAC2 n=1 Tax=Magnusiomyces paraingens TaxID=2606893 RepID=A0A5E8C1M5_9ASCO|nr:uncharacterized protein SAPINGB_P005357 [Saprochaete ingens]VVT56870.1 unnamed protein product [Saprochaete ingens]
MSAKEETPDVQMEDAGSPSQYALDPEKIVILPGASPDGTAASFQIKNEDHTLGNPLRYIIMKNPDVEFCGYSIPHPSEAKLNIRIQTYGQTTAFQALQKGLKDLVDLCDHTERLFRQRVTEGNYGSEEPN